MESTHQGQIITATNEVGGTDVVREHSTGADVRDTRNRTHDRLTFSPKTWNAFLLSLTRSDNGTERLLTY